jgi:aldose sugar dehydrogenase
LSILMLFRTILLTILISSFTIVGSGGYSFNLAQATEKPAEFPFPQKEFTSGNDESPDIKDSNLKAEVVADGLDLPTTMAFLGPNDILVLEKEKGTVQRIVDGKTLSEPLLDVNVAAAVERCMCGIAISKNGSTTYVFLYYTEAETADKEDMTKGKEPIGNRLYRYELADNKLVNPKLLLDLPAAPGPRHNGGAIIVGPDNNIYVAIGDVDGTYKEGFTTKAQNYVEDGSQPDGRGGILRVTQDGQPVGNGIIGNKFPLNLYYAYGVRSSFGLDFDPLTGKLWDTENGAGYADEINLVYPGFNSGWKQVQGMASLKSDFDPKALVNFDGKGEYSDPKFEWVGTVGPTAIKFLNSSKLGQQYENNIFVGDVHEGRIYHFKLNADRTELVLDGQLADKVAETQSEDELKDIIFGTGFGGITDLEVGPDGYLYALSIGQGKIFKIVPQENGGNVQDNNNNVNNGNTNGNTEDNSGNGNVNTQENNQGNNNNNDINTGNTEDNSGNVFKLAPLAPQ